MIGGILEEMSAREANSSASERKQRPRGNTLNRNELIIIEPLRKPEVKQIQIAPIQPTILRTYEPKQQPYEAPAPPTNNHSTDISEINACTIKLEALKIDNLAYSEHELTLRGLAVRPGNHRREIYFSYVNPNLD